MKHTDITTTPENNDIEHFFSSLPLSDLILTNLESLNYKQMTPIQAKSLPLMLNGDDIIAKAKTGSGKTAAFGLALLHRLNVKLFAAQALVLCPTRELAEQVCQALRRLARLMPNVKIINLSGGIPMRPQLDSLRHGSHIVVGTPGRVQKHLDKQSLTLDKLQVLVLDEADRMLDMGFLEDIKKIIDHCPKKRQNLLFSATYPDTIKALCSDFFHNMKDVTVDVDEKEQPIEQRFYEVDRAENKFSLLSAILLHYKPSSSLIFCNTKQQTSIVTDMLQKTGFSALALNGDMEQVDRDLVLTRFTNKSCSILVATDVAARGLDIKELPAVINFDLAFDKDVHIHRIGRTGRAGSHGLALSLTTSADAYRVCAIEDNLGQPVSWGNQNDLTTNDKTIPLPEMITLCINSGRKDKIRPGDVLGALTKDAGLPGDAIGKINITALHAYIAIHRNQIDKAYRYLQNGTLKGKKVSVRKVH